MHLKARHSHQLVADGIAEIVLLRWTVYHWQSSYRIISFILIENIHWILEIEIGYWKHILHIRNITLVWNFRIRKT